MISQYDDINNDVTTCTMYNVGIADAAIYGTKQQLKQETLNQDKATARYGYHSLAVILMNNGVFYIVYRGIHSSHSWYPLTRYRHIPLSSSSISGVRSQNGSSLIPQLGLHPVLRYWIHSLLYPIPVAPKG